MYKFQSVYMKLTHKDSTQSLPLCHVSLINSTNSPTAVLIQLGVRYGLYPRGEWRKDVSLIFLGDGRKCVLQSYIVITLASDENTIWNLSSAAPQKKSLAIFSDHYLISLITHYNFTVSVHHSGHQGNIVNALMVRIKLLLPQKTCIIFWER